MSLLNYLEDGADPQARAVLAYLSQYDGVEASWNDNVSRYLAEPKIARWHNCREQGYITYMSSPCFTRQINIAFFEHRNSDQICCVVWDQTSAGNPLNIQSMDTQGTIYKDKYDVSHAVPYGAALKMAEYIMNELEEFWIEVAGVKDA